MTLAVLFLTCGGHRGIVFRNLKIGEWREAFEEYEAETSDTLIALVHKHKTDKTYGAASLPISNDLIMYVHGRKM